MMISKLSATLTCLSGGTDDDTPEMEYIQIAFKKMGGLLTMVCLSLRALLQS